MDWLIRKLRDLDAKLTAYGQCIRCRRSWRYASPVMVGFRDGRLRLPSSSYFALCISCYRHEVIKPDAGLILQGWAVRAMDGQEPRDMERRTTILAAYGMAPRFPVELDMSFGDGPQTYRVRVIDERRRNRLGRADLSPTGERVASPQPRIPAPIPAQYKVWPRLEEMDIDQLQQDGAQGHGHGHPAADGADGRDGHAS